MRIGIAGGGIGGLSLAIALRKFGFDPVVYEQARRFGRVGADINLTPNAVRALDGLGIGPVLRESAAWPKFRLSRMWDSGEETSRLPMSNEAEAKYGAPQLTLHRADLLSALEQALPADTIALGRQVAGVRQHERGIVATFADGTTESLACLIGADGIHSAVRRSLFGADAPRFTGIVAFRAVIPAADLRGVPNLDVFTKWWGPTPDSQIVAFPLSRGEEMFVFATIAQNDWLHESWTMPGDADELRAIYRDFHPDARALLAPCREVLKSALYERDPMPSWSSGLVTLLGDACHPMLPFMAQGAGQAVEDAVVLARCVAARGDDFAAAFRDYEALRLARTAKVQLLSRGNAWLKANESADWLYGYDAWHQEAAA